MTSHKKVNVSNPILFGHNPTWGLAIQKIVESLHNPSSKIFFDTFCDYRADSNTPLDYPWIGIFHYPTKITHRVLEKTAWLNNCLGLFTLVKSSARLLRSHFSFPAQDLTYPTNQPHLYFDPSNFKKKIVMVGQSQRDFNEVYRLSPPLGWDKYILQYDHDEAFWNNYSVRLINHRGGEVRLIPRLNDVEYQKLLTETVIFLPFLNCTAASTTIIECIMRNTPVLTNRYPEVVEYLGEGYPLLFDNLDEAEYLLSDEKNIFLAHQYLKELPKTRFSFETFIHEITTSEVYRQLPCPTSSSC